MKSMKSKILVIFAVLFSLLFALPGSGNLDQPTITTFDMHGGA